MLYNFYEKSSEIVESQFILQRNWVKETASNNLTF